MKYLVVAALLLARVAHAETPASQPSGLDFDLLGPQAPVAPAPVNRALKIRRTMLQLHQGAGFVLLALSAGTAISGQLNYSDRFLGSSTGQFEVPHAVFAYSTFSLFVATAALAIFAPSPFDKENVGVSRVLIHKIGMYGAAACMVAEVILGVLTTKNEGLATQQALGMAHLVNGYTTFALMTAGVSALVF